MSPKMSKLTKFSKINRSNYCQSDSYQSYVNLLDVAINEELQVNILLSHFLVVLQIIMQMKFDKRILHSFAEMNLKTILFYGISVANAYLRSYIFK